MNTISCYHLRGYTVKVSPIPVSCSPNPSLNLSFPSGVYPILNIPQKTFSVQARKRNLQHESVLKPNIVEEVYMDNEDDDVLLDELQHDELLDDDDLTEEDYEADDTELCLGDGCGGGGIKLAGTWWDKEALAIAEDVSSTLDGDLTIYAFKTSSNSVVQVRIEKLSNTSGSPSIAEIEAFARSYRARLDEGQLSGSIPENISLEVSSPGVERVVRVPQDLDRYKHRPMYVKYVIEESTADLPAEGDGIFRLVSFDLETKSCTWGIADVKINREKAGKGRPLSKKQRDWRLNTSFDSLRLVRLHSEA